MLIEQNGQLRLLETIRTELRGLRVQELDDPGAAIAHLRGERVEALASLRSAEADLAALRNLNQRLMVENSRLLQAAEQRPG
jgi:hypothetical protein